MLFSSVPLSNSLVSLCLILLKGFLNRHGNGVLLVLGLPHALLLELQRMKDTFRCARMSAKNNIRKP